MPTPDGAFVVNEPQGSPAWYPANDNPRDKATYTLRVSVPDGLTVMANGVLAAAERISGMELDPFFQTWLYEEGKPTSW